MAHLKGRSVLLYTLAQLVSGTAAAGNYNARRHYGFTPRRTDPLVDDPLLGEVYDNVVDAQSPAEGLVEAGFDLSLPMCLNELGFELLHLFGAAAPSGVGPYTHVFTSGVEAHGGDSKAWVEGANWRVANTVVHSRMEIGLGQESGKRQIKFSSMASDIATVGASPLGTPAAALAANIFPAGRGCQVKRGGVVLANVVGGTMFYQRPLVPFRPAGNADRLATEFTPDVGASLGGSLDIRVVDDTFYDIARAKTAAAMDFVWSIDAGNSFTISCPAVRLEPGERAVSGPGLRTESYTMRGEQTAAAPCVTATLINSIAAYPVEV